MQVHVTKM
jgi:hypothetical protein